MSRLASKTHGGAHLENCTDNVSCANPGVVYAVHTSYLEAGADIIETNSFNGHPVSLVRVSPRSRRPDINHAAAGAGAHRRGRVFVARPSPGVAGAMRSHDAVHHRDT